jgi:DivIVA domain-containing protein
MAPASSTCRITPAEVASEYGVSWPTAHKALVAAAGRWLPEPGYATAEVDALRQEIRDTFLGVRQPPLTSHAVHGKRFSTHRRGYDVEQVDAFLDQAELTLAAMRPTDVVVEVQRMKITIVREHVR